MRSDEHKAEAERLIEAARTSEGKKAVGRYGDPSDPLAATALAGVHAQLAQLPDDVVEAEVVDDEAEQLVDEARTLASELVVGTVNMSSSSAADLLRRLANALEERAGQSSGVQINADAFDADSQPIEVEREAIVSTLEIVRSRQSTAERLAIVDRTLEGWLR